MLSLLTVFFLLNYFCESQVRQSLIMAITDQRPASLQSVKLISGSLYQATQIINEVSPKAQVLKPFENPASVDRLLPVYTCKHAIYIAITFFQEASTSALTSMAAFLDRESRETGSGSVDSVAASMCGAMGNVLGAASDAAAVNQPSSTNQTFEQKNVITKMRGKVSCLLLMTNMYDI